MALERRREQLAHEKSPGIVVVETHFLEHNLLLGLEEIGLQAGVHADVHEHLDARHDLARRQDRVIEGVVPRRPGVDTSADSLDLALDEPCRARRRTLEEHVLEIVGQPQLARALVPRARLHPELQRDDVAGAMLLDDHRDAVGEDVP